MEGKSKTSQFIEEGVNSFFRFGIFLLPSPISFAQAKFSNYWFIINLPCFGEIILLSYGSIIDSTFFIPKYLYQKGLDMNFDSFGGRKAIIAFIFFLTSTIFFFFNHETFQAWAY